MYIPTLVHKNIKDNKNEENNQNKAFLGSISHTKAVERLFYI